MNNVRQYNGVLTSAQIAEGMNLATSNAKRLYDSAELLFSGGDYPTSSSLSVLAIEEAGKVSLLRGMAMAVTDDDWKECWRQYRKHLEKSRMTGCLFKMHSGLVKLEEFKHEYIGKNPTSGILDNIKQFGFYTDCIGTGRWVSPELKITVDVAAYLLMLAKVQCCSKATVTTREIELWKEYLLPVRHAPYETMKKGLLEWHQRMVAEGLRDADQGFEDFVRNGFDFCKMSS